MPNIEPIVAETLKLRNDHRALELQHEALKIQHEAVLDKVKKLEASAEEMWFLVASLDPAGSQEIEMSECMQKRESRFSSFDIEVVEESPVSMVNQEVETYRMDLNELVGSSASSNEAGSWVVN